MASISFQSPQAIAIMGRIKNPGGPKECKRCARNAIRRNPQAVPLHPNAVLAGSTFTSYGKLDEMVGADYEGPAVLISTTDNHSLTIGPNHPILTNRGMVKASDLTESDYLLYDLRFNDSSTRIGIETNLKNVPLVEEAFESISLTGSKTLVATASHDLHGDRIFCKGEINVVEPADSLLFKLDSSGIEKFREGNFVGTDMKPVVLSGNGSGELSSVAVSLTSTGGVSSTLSSYVLLHVLSIHYVDFKGKAFDATTETGIYNSNGFVVSNCRCKEARKTTL